MDTLTGSLARTLYHAPDRYSRAGAMRFIGKLHDGHTVIGQLSRPVLGESYIFYGEWKAQKGKYAESGPAFEFSEHEPMVERSKDGIAAFLAKHVPGLGPARSEAIVEEYGLEAIEILRADPRKAMVIPGITEKTVASIRTYFESDEGAHAHARARLNEMFSGFTVPKKVVNNLIKHFKSSAPEVVLKNPYVLLQIPGMGWEKTDEFAIAGAKYDRDGLDRHKAAIVEALNLLDRDGHTWGAGPEIEGLAFHLVGSRIRGDAWKEAVDQRLVIRVDGEAVGRGVEAYALPKIAAAEETIARRLVRLAATALPLSCELSTDGLEGEQVAAVKVIGENGVSTLTGAPGTGKSFTTSKVLGSLFASGLRSIRVAAPTGKAAKRAAELIAENVPEAAESDEQQPCPACNGTGIYDPEGDGDSDLDCRDCDGTGLVSIKGGIPCTTVHRLLRPKPSDEPEGVPSGDSKLGRGRDEFAFGHNETKPIRVDYLVVDEFSMVDVELGASLLRAVPDGTRVLIVGDQNQLPSVGAGSVLRDVMDALPAAYLSEIRRSQPGRVIRACHEILAGRVPIPADRIDLAAGENWYHIELDGPHDIAREIVELHKATKTFPDPVWDMQVVTPQKTKLPIACDNLNSLLSSKLNPRAVASVDDGWQYYGPNGQQVQAPQASDDHGEPPYRVGDKVVRTKNGLADLLIDIGAPDDFDWATGEFAHEEEDRRVDWHWKGRDYKFREIDVVNGDMGQIEAIVEGPKDTYVVVRFRTPDRLCRLPFGSASHLTLAYAMTCHRAQGSGFPFVVVPVHHSFYWDAKEEKGIFNREWIYTAISRAEKLLVTVGQYSAIRAAVGRRTIHKRKTRLAGLLRAMAADPMLAESPAIEVPEVDTATATATAHMEAAS